MRHFLAAAAAVLALAACSDGAGSPVGPAQTNLTPAPNLYIYNIYPGTQSFTVRVCNGGDASAPASYLRLEHFWSPWLWSNQSVWPDVATPALAAGTCTYVTIAEGSDFDQVTNEYYVWVDTFGDVAESNESDNYQHYTY